MVTEQGSVPFTIPADVLVPFSDLASKVQAWFDHISLKKPDYVSGNIRVPPQVAACDDCGGVKIPWLSETKRPSNFVPSFTSAKDRPTVYKTLVRELSCGFISQVLPSNIVAAGLLFLVDKERVVYDPEEINDLSADVSVAFPRASDLLAPNYVLCGVKGDVKAAFRHIAIAREDQKYFGIILDGIYLRWNRLPFGLKQAPAFFVAAYSAVTALFDFGDSPRDVSYMDDSALARKCPLDLLSTAWAFAQHLDSHGFSLATAKWYLLPASKLVFTGLSVEFDVRRLTIPASKTAKAMSWLTSAIALSGATCSAFLNQHDIPSAGVDMKMNRRARATIQRLLGMLSWFSLAISVITVFRRNLDESIISGSWSVEALSEIEWLSTNLPPCMTGTLPYSLSFLCSASSQMLPQRGGAR